MFGNYVDKIERNLKVSSGSILYYFFTSSIDLVKV